MQALPPHLERILNLARWTPSGDNTQPWRFEILGNEHILVHGFDTRDHVVYDLDGHSSQLALGALLETISTAASAEGRSASIHRRPNTTETRLLFDIHFEPKLGMTPDALVPHIETRMVQRRSMSTRALSAEQKQVLAASLPEGYSVHWHETLAQRWYMAKFMFACAKIRLTIPEAYVQHKSIIEWGAQFSTDKVPGQAVGVDPITARFMSWVMGSWQRVEFFNKFLLGHLPPRLQLELLPSLRCGAHFTLSAPALSSVDDYLSAGRAMQRFWLSAAKIGWFIQPEMTSVIFTRYHRHGIAFSKQQNALALARRLNDRLAQIVSLAEIDRIYFVGRIGAGPRPMARSTRKTITQLLITPPPSPVTQGK